MKKVLISLAVALTMKTQSVWACATCFGAEGDPQTEGLNMAILTLMIVTYSLFTGMALTAFLIWRRNQKALLEQVDSDVVVMQGGNTTHV